MAKLKRQPVDALTGLVMVVQADPSDLVTISMGKPSHTRPRKYCMSHLEEMAHRMRHAKDAKKFPPSVIDRYIVRDDVADNVRKSIWHVYEVRATSDRIWHECPHCRLRAAGRDLPRVLT